MRLLLSCLALLSAALPSPAPAQTPAKPSTQPAAPFASESLVVDHLSTIFTVAADGTGSRHIIASTRIQSEAAAREYSVLTIPFAGDAEQVEILSARVLHPDGTITVTPAADAQTMPQPVTREAPFYSDLKEVQLPIRSLSPGDRLEYDTRIRILHPEAPGHFWGQTSFVDRFVVLDETVELHLPRTTYSKVWSPTHPPATTSELGDERIFVWKSKHLTSSVKADGTAADTPELDPKGTLPDIAWTSFHDWPEVGAWYSTLSAGRSTPDDAIRAKVADLTAGKPTLDAKQHAVYDFVATQIRYIGVAFGIGRYQPHTASEILRNQYGDCKDKHTLLAAMLSVLGTPPDAVLIGAGIRFNPDLPSPGAFNHLITVLPSPSGTPGKDAVWLDATAEVAPWGMLTAVTRDHEALVVPPTGPAMVAQTPISPPFASFGSFAAKATLDPTGTAHAHIDWTERGDGELVLRALLRQIPPAKWPDLAQGVSRQLGFSGTTSHVDATRPELTSIPARLSYDYEREKLGDWDSLRIIPLLPVVFVPTLDEKKPPKYPIQLGEPHIETSHTELKLPAGWTADLPAAVDQRSTFLAFDKTYTVKDGTLTVDRRLEVLRKEVPAADWRAYQKWYDATLKDGEPYIQLHTADGSTTLPDSNTKALSTGTSSASPTAPSDPLSEAQRDIAMHRFDLAQPLLDKLQAANPRQPGIWSAFGFLAFQQFHFADAISDYTKELALYPDTDAVYFALADAQVALGQRNDALATLRRDATRKPDDLKIARRLATLENEAGDPKAAVATLQAAITHLGDTKPEDQLRIQLAAAQLAANDPAGRSTLRSILHQSSDPYALNNAAYTLSAANQDLDQAEAGARRALDLLADQTSAQTLTEITPTQAALSRLTVALWDTLGELLIQQAKLDVGEPFLRAAWRFAPNAETGLHLARLEERLGHQQAALDLYELATDREHADLLRSRYLAPALHTDLATHRDALRAAGLKPSFENVSVALAQQRILSSGKTVSKQGSADYLLLIQNGKIVESRLSPNHPQTGIPEAQQLVAATDVSSWMPSTYTARMLLAASLACDQNTCKLVLQSF